MIRLCCGQEHFGAMCPDGKTMCCLCFDRFDLEDLNVVSIDFEGQHEDVCKSCAEAERLTSEQKKRYSSGQGVTFKGPMTIL